MTAELTKLPRHGDNRPASTDLIRLPEKLLENTTVLTTAGPDDGTDAHAPADRRTPLLFTFSLFSLDLSPRRFFSLLLLLYLYFNEPNLTYGFHAPEMLWSRDSEASK
ncbi:LOW QUALITY PROTEIN: hypothetical protein YC2023_091163 [Brassica napus]